MTLPRTTYVGIARLLSEYRATHSASYADLAAKTGLGRSTFGYLINTPPPVPVSAETIRAIATGLDLPMQVVVEASLVTQGLSTHEPALPDETLLLARRIARLSWSEQKAVKALIASFLD